TAAGGVLIAVARAQGPAGNAQGLEQVSIWLASILVWIGSTGLPGEGFGRMVASFPPWVGATARGDMWGGIGVTIVCFVFAVWLAGRRVQKAFRLRVPDQAQIDRKRRWFAPRFFRVIRERRRRRWLATNPARWLFSFSPTAGLGRWGWVLVIGLSWGILISLATADVEIFELTRFLPIVLALGMAMASAASFRQEIEEGTLELLLVTPLSTHHLVWARVRQIWALFIPATALSVALALIRPVSQFSGGVSQFAEWAGLVSLVTLPSVGIRYAVRRLHPLNGFFWTAFTATVPPLLFGFAMTTFAGLDRDLAFVLGFAISQLVLGGLCGWLAANDLERRWYTLRPLQRPAR
ncbi:MAG TPA: hypothetical protein DCE44_14785, partial [Verrucomicrobiales bacterium]|nr:hypothetical protein [Verrucomicrobiales bacterium]